MAHVGRNLAVLIFAVLLSTVISADQSTPIFGLIPVNSYPVVSATAPYTTPSPTAPPSSGANSVCDVRLSKNMIDTSVDFSANAKRVTVFGSAKGSNFNDRTYVVINCNAGNTLPLFSMEVINAHNIALSESSLSYTGNCNYPSDQTGKAYTVTAQLIQNDNGTPYSTPCLPKTDNTVFVKAGTGANTPSSVTSAAPFPTTPVNSAIPIPSGETKLMRFALDNTWNLFGVPFGQTTSAETSCVSKAYYFDTNSHTYVLVKDWTNPSLVGKGIWAKRASPRSVSGDCILSFNGGYLDSQSIPLQKGWNMVSIQTMNSLETSNNQDCQIIRGPYMYSGFTINGKKEGYLARTRLDNGNGYWIKVAQDCTIYIQNPDQPPAPPLDTSNNGNTNTINSIYNDNKAFATAYPGPSSGNPSYDNNVYIHTNSGANIVDTGIG